MDRCWFLRFWCAKRSDDQKQWNFYEVLGFWLASVSNCVGKSRILHVHVGYYRPQRSWAKVMFLQVSVILLTGEGLPQCMLGCQTPPQTRQIPPDRAYPPGPGRPPWTRQTHPPPGPGRPPSDQADTPLDQADPSGTRQTPPSIGSMSGRYASYWNAFLFFNAVAFSLFHFDFFS